ncbi:PDR/VanB family oxidoreductase [Paraburkholderia caballeronis]|uniref:PDR/VanB family oxidoreductase n=1 Tax=Paraburkholderia caballeronis TaxID=416943 RepID=UPI001066EAC8|nr:PDR/VanB family oxidoreductase [Paraburkholderia caballeronis]TDV21107.1 vanillate O-demethylase ferredoxin subunit [Paraburkholderia caballeronis]TDV21536.1 vanillate O-demethylase ferredoxin subunit [Paraburkholderia caballeronis]TDV33575.1 vanillate O-demethylase ferredoxin subunit [Paraburkholderia caballeronis]
MKSSLHPVRVDAIRDEAPGIRSFVVSRIDGAPFDAYEAGAHIDVTGPSGIVRQYSLCGDPDDTRRHVFAVKREPASRGGSSALHDHVEVGTQLVIGAPRNRFRLAPQAGSHVLVGAGIGVTPLVSMAYRLVRDGAPFVLHYFVRSEAHAAFLPLLTQSPFGERLRLHCGVEPADLDTTLAGILAPCEADAHVYTCGPGPFMDQVIDTASRHVPTDAVHFERFSAEADRNEAPDATANASTFDIRLARSGQTVRVNPGISIVDALASIGVEIDTSCGEGVCGTCMIDVVDGEPDHRDHCLSQAERAGGKTICCCVSRSRSPLLVLDL